MLHVWRAGKVLRCNLLTLNPGYKTLNFEVSSAPLQQNTTLLFREVTHNPQNYSPFATSEGFAFLIFRRLIRGGAVDRCTSE